MRHLQSRAQFQAVMACGILVRSAHFALHWRAASACAQDAAFAAPAAGGALADLLLGPLVPKRWARRSVTRHAIRRQIYAAAQTHEAGLPSGACVVRLRAAFERRVFISASSDALKRAVRAELQQLFAAACARLEKPAAAQNARMP